MRLFKVKYTDGTVYQQTEEDKSSIDPKRSAFYDVLNSGKDILSFSIGPASVNLITGMFKLSLLEFQLEENLQPVKRKLIFFRQVQQDTNVDYENKGGVLKILNLTPSATRIKYFIGYEYKLKGKNHKFLIGIK